MLNTCERSEIHIQSLLPVSVSAVFFFLSFLSCIFLSSIFSLFCVLPVSFLCIFCIFPVSFSFPCLVFSWIGSGDNGRLIWDMDLLFMLVCLVWIRTTFSDESVEEREYGVKYATDCEGESFLNVSKLLDCQRMIDVSFPFSN